MYMNPLHMVQAGVKIDVIECFDAFCKTRQNIFNARDHFLNCKQDKSRNDEYQVCDRAKKVC